MTLLSTTISYEDRIALSRRMAQRRKQLKLTQKQTAQAAKVQPHLIPFLEKCLPEREHGSEWAVENALGVPRGWLRKKSILSQSNDELDEFDQLSPTATSHKLSMMEREKLGKRAKLRRNDLRLTLAEVCKDWSTKELLASRERAISAFPKDYEKQWEAALMVPPGWLRDTTIHTPEPQWSITEKLAEAVDQQKSKDVLESVKSFADEVRLVSYWLARSRPARRTYIYAKLTDGEIRNANVFARRFGVGGAGASTLQEVGDHFGITRERVRQIEATFLDRAGSLPFKPIMIDILADAIKPELPCKLSHIDEKFSHILGENLAVVDADRFARTLFGRQLITYTDRPAGGAVSWDDIAINSDEHIPENYSAFRSVSRSMIRTCGAAHMSSVIGIINSTNGIPISLKEAEKACRLIPGFEWLIKDDGWFWFGPTSENRLINVTGKVLAVANQNVDIEDIASAVTRSRWRQVEEGRNRPILLEAPMIVMCEVLRRYPGFLCVQSNDFRLAGDITADFTLSNTEQMVRQYLESRGGVASRNAIQKALTKKGKIIPVTLHLCLDTSPILTRIDRGVFALRGYTYNPDAIRAAYRDVDGKNRQNKHPNFKSKDGWIQISLKLSENMFKTLSWRMPVGLGRKLESGDFQIEGKSSPARLTILKGDRGFILSGFINKLKQDGFTVGDAVKIEMHPEQRSIRYQR